MDKARFGAILLLLAAPVAASAKGADERLVSPALPGFVLGYSAGNAAQSIREEVPRGETVQAWTRMVTTQWFAGLAARATPAAFARNMIAGLGRSCPSAKISPVTALKVTGQAAIRFQADCPDNGKGQRESFMLLAVAGGQDMHVKQVALRGPRTAQDVAWANTLLAGTAFCAAGDRRPDCRR